LRLARAQRNTIEQAFQTAAAVCDSVFSDLKIAVASPPDLADQDPRTITDEPLSDLVTRFLALFVSAGIPESHARLHAVNAARRVQLVRGFDEPDSIVEMVTAKAQDIAQAFPRTASDLECGRNPGDVLDPFILTATQTLLYGGDFASAIGATVAHKALMIIEGLIGHLHEDVIGHMRGNVKAPEPRGFNQEIIDLETNPFPGADIVQPPTSANGALRFHQVKSKTGSAKGGDGKRLGDQLRVLAQYYHGEVFYDALTGNTLKGHRSMGAVLTAAPNAVVLVGSAAFKALTGSTHGAELLLRLYQTAFTEAAIRSGYAIDAMTVGIVETFRARAAECGDGLLESILADSTSGQEDDQDSRIFPPAVRRRARTGG
jgi:hypothetical protein